MLAGGATNTADLSFRGAVNHDENGGLVVLDGFGGLCAVGRLHPRQVMPRIGVCNSAGMISGRTPPPVRASAPSGWNRRRVSAA